MEQNKIRKFHMPMNAQCVSKKLIQKRIEKKKEADTAKI